MNISFKESFNYLVAFLAVLFGLSAFKEDLASIKLWVFGRAFDAMDISVPFIILMIVATYLGALALISRNFTFRPFPLTAVLEKVSYILAFLGLIYPILVAVVLSFSSLAATVAQLDEQVVSIAVSVVSGALGVLSAYRLATVRLKERYEVKLNELRKIAVETDTINTQKTSSYEIVMLFHQFTALSKAILRLKGYGVSDDNTYLISKMLESINIFDDHDLETVRKLRKFRNKIVHEPLQARISELTTARKELETLITKLKEEILKLERSDI